MRVGATQLHLLRPCDPHSPRRRKGLFPCEYVQPLALTEDQPAPRYIEPGDPSTDIFHSRVLLLREGRGLKDVFWGVGGGLTVIKSLLRELVASPYTAGTHYHLGQRLAIPERSLTCKGKKKLY